jgi:hypothetical protein
MASLRQKLESIFNNYNTALIDIQESMLRQDDWLLVASAYVLLAASFESTLKDVLTWLLQFKEQSTNINSGYIQTITTIIEWEYGVKDSGDGNWKSQFVDLCKPSNRNSGKELHRIFMLLPNTLEHKMIFESMINNVIHKRNNVAHGTVFFKPTLRSSYNQESLLIDIEQCMQLKDVLKAACEDLIKADTTPMC